MGRGRRVTVGSFAALVAALATGCEEPDAASAAHGEAAGILVPTVGRDTPPWEVLGGTLTSEGYVRDLGWLPDGTLLVLSGGGRSKLPSEGLPAMLDAADPVDRWLAALASATPAPPGHRLRAWNVATGEIVRRYRLDGSAFAVSPDGRWVAARGADGRHHLYDPATGEAVERAPEELPAGPLAWSPDGQRLASAHQVTLAIWTVAAAEAELVELPASAPERTWVEALAWSADGRRLAVATRTPVSPLEAGPLTVHLLGAEGTVGPARAFDGVTGITWLGSDLALAGDPVRLVRGDGSFEPVWSGGRPACALAASPDGGRLAAVDAAGVLVVRDADGRALGEALTAPCARLAFAPDGRTLAAARGAAIELFSVGADGVPVRTTTERHPHAVEALAASPDGGELLSLGFAGELLAWDPAQGSARALGRLPRRPTWDSDRGLGRGERGWAGWSGDRVLTVGERVGDPQVGTIGWQVEARHALTGEILARFTLPDRPDEAALAADGTLVARAGAVVHVASRDGEVEELPIPGVRAISRDGARGVEAGAELVVRELGSGAARAVLHLPPDAEHCVFAPDDRSIACRGPGWVGVADATTGEALAQVASDGPPPDAADAPPVEALALGAGLVAALTSGRLEVFDIATGAEVLDTVWTEPRLTAAQPLPSEDGPLLALGDAWGRIHLVPLAQRLSTGRDGP